jgi:YHS domain-containing protein
MSFHLRIFLGLLFLAAFPREAHPQSAPATPPANEMCPVRPDEKALSEFKLEHQGRTIYFCCEACVQRFRENPDPYLSNLEAPAKPADSASAPKPNPRLRTGWEWAEPLLAAAEFCLRRPIVPVALVAAYLFTTAAATFHRRWTRGGATPGLGTRMLGLLSCWGTFAALVLAAACVDLWLAKGRAEAALDAARTQAIRAEEALEEYRNPRSGAAAYPYLEKVLHYSWPQGFHALPRGTSNTFYRGNDERSEKLFNGGNYRTATYHVSLRAADGREVRSGDAVQDQPLAVRCEIVRAPNTAPEFFSADRMAGVFFTRGDPAREAKRLTIVRPDRHWMSDLPVGVVPVAGEHEIRGVWLMFAGRAEDPPTLAGAACWYYIQYTLFFRDGRLDERSTVWMMSVFPSPKLTGANSDAQWFSDRPIPEIPDGKNATDPKLLGSDNPDGAKPGNPQK